MEKETVIKELKQEAETEIQSNKKSQQLLIVVILLLIFFVVYWLVISARPTIIPNTTFMEAMESIGATCLFIIIIFGVFLPFGKISQDKLNMYFKYKLQQRIKSKENELEQADGKKDKIVEELEILKEI